MLKKPSKHFIVLTAFLCSQNVDEKFYSQSTKTNDIYEQVKFDEIKRILLSGNKYKELYPICEEYCQKKIQEIDVKGTRRVIVKFVKKK